MIEEKERKGVEGNNNWNDGYVYIYIFLGDCASYLRSLFIKKDHSRELKTEWWLASFNVFTRPLRGLSTRALSRLENGTFLFLFPSKRWLSTTVDILLFDFFSSFPSFSSLFLMFPNDTIIEGHWRKVERRNRECGGIKGDGRMMIVNDWIMKR